MERPLHVRGQGEGGAGGGGGPRVRGECVAGIQRHREGGVLPIQTLRVKLGVGRGVEAVIPARQGEAPHPARHPAGLLHRGQVLGPAEARG